MPVPVHRITRAQERWIKGALPPQRRLFVEINKIANAPDSNLAQVERALRGIGLLWKHHGFPDLEMTKVTTNLVEKHRKLQGKE